MNFKTKRKVLLIDDEQHFCSLAEDILAVSHCELRYFTDSHAGLREALMRSDLDLIILDIDMPEPNGLEILRQLKKSHNRKVPVMMFTAHAEMDVVKNALELGAQDYLLKPFSVHDFVSRLNHILQIDIFYNLSPFNPEDIGSQKKPISEPVSNFSEPTLLLMADVSGFKQLKELFEDSVCKLVHCDNAQAGLEKVFQKIPDLVLLDMQMQDLNAIEFLADLRNVDKKMPLIIINGDSSQEVISKISHFQLDAYLYQPYRFHRLIAELERVLHMPLFAERL
jgi:DNA-binding response OmpR family regulator